MIKFFRKIRQKLVTENKFSKYLLYAIGEIILVVFGILIALQINNWNENRKDRVYEIKMLTEVAEDLESDSIMLSYQMTRIKNFEKSIQEFISDFQNQKIDNSDRGLFGGVYFIFNTKAMENIKSGSTQIPFDDELRKLISNHYHNSEFYIDLLNLEDKKFNDFISNPIQKNYFQLVPTKEDYSDYYFKIIDPEKALQSKGFQDFIVLRNNRVNRWKWAYDKVYNSTVECKKEIERYLQTNYPND